MMKRILSIENIDIRIVISKLKIISEYNGISSYDMTVYNAMFKRIPPYKKGLRQDLYKVLADLGYHGRYIAGSKVMTFPREDIPWRI